MQTFFKNFMTQGDYETFYPYLMGVGKGAPNNFESSYDENNDPDLDDQNDDQENTEYEAADLIDGVEEEQLPCYRELVRAKKRELKDKYGKGKFKELGLCGLPPGRLGYAPNVRIGTVYAPSRDCGIRPLRIEYSPNVRIGTRIYNNTAEYDRATARFEADKKVWEDCTNESGKVLIQGNTAEYDRATARFDADKLKYDNCMKNNKLWTPGWRREWRKFKKQGGLKDFKTKSVRCLFGVPQGNSPIKPPVVPPVVPPVIPPIEKTTFTKKVTPIVRNKKETNKTTPNVNTDNIALKTKDNTKTYMIVGIVAAVVIILGALIYRNYKK